MTSSITNFSHERLWQLSQAGQSLRSIGQRLAVAPATVHKRLQEIGDAPLLKELLPDESLTDDELRPGYEPANLRRCRGCGALVYLWPCLACCLAEETAERAADGDSIPLDREQPPC